MMRTRFRRDLRKGGFARSLHFESLEDRRLLATVSWGGLFDAAWSNPAAWDCSCVPSPGDDVILPEHGGAYIVELDISYDSVSALNSLSIDSPDASLIGSGQTLSIDGSLSNRGVLDLVSSSTFNMRGAVHNQGFFRVLQSTFNFNSGTVTGNDPLLDRAMLNIAAAATGAASFTTGGHSVLTGELAASQTVTIQGGLGNNLPAELFASDGFTNNGTINIQPRTNFTPLAAQLTVASGQLINNGQINLRDGGAAVLSADLQNNALINVESPQSFFSKTGGVYHNGGTINIGAIAVLTIFGDNQTFDQVSGGVVNQGGFNLAFATLNFSGGTMTGNAPSLLHSALNISSSSQAAFVLNGNTLYSGNLSQAQSLALRSSGGITSILTAAQGFTNAGTIDVDRAGLLVTDGSLTNEGTLNFIGNNSVLNGDLVNRGLISVPAQTVRFDKPGAAYLNSGIVDVTGSLTISGGTLRQPASGATRGGGAITLFHSELLGAGQVDVTLVSTAGVVSPGAQSGQTGILNLGGDLLHGIGAAAGTIDIELGGTVPGTGYDQLNIAGTGLLRGILNISLINGFVPQPCDRFEIVTGGDLIFASWLIGLDLGGGLHLRPEIGTNSIALVAYDQAAPIRIGATTLSVEEGGSSAEYEVCISAAAPPAADVTVNVSGDTQVNANPTVLTFTPANWQTPQSVTIVAVDDTLVEGPHIGIVTHTSSSSDSNFQVHSLADVVVGITDNDAVPNTPPVARPDDITTDEDTAVLIDVLADNGQGVDFDADSNIEMSLTVNLNAPTRGSLTNHGDGTFTFDPVGQFDALDAGDSTTVSFDYRIQDAHGETAAARVSIAVTGVNDAPRAVADSASTTENAPVSIAVLANDSDVDDEDGPAVFSLDAVSIISTTGLRGSPGAAGTAAVVGQHLVFDPGAEFDELGVGETSTVTVLYTMSDDQGAGSSSIAEISVHGQNDKPVMTALSSNHRTPENKSIDGQTTVSGTFSERDLTDVHTVTVDWGDSTPVELVPVDQTADSFASGHTYSSAGIFTITVTVDDGEGGTDTQTTTSVVQGAGVSNRVLYVVGTDERDHVLIRRDRGNQLLLKTRLGGKAARHLRVDRDAIDAIVIVVCGGDDHVHVGKHIEIPALVLGGDGNDRIKTGAGDDQVSDLKGHNFIRTGSGADQVIVGDGNNWIVSGAGNDVVKTGHGRNIIFSGHGDDEIRTGDGRNKVWAGQGDDLVVTGSGNDWIGGGSGDDLILAGAGSDHVVAGSGNDIVNAGTGNDRIHGGHGDDLLIAGSGRDTAYGNRGDDLIVAGSTSHDNSQAALIAALADWTSGDLAAALVDLGAIVDDNDRDCLQGNHGQDDLFGGIGDGVKA